MSPLQKIMLLLFLPTIVGSAENDVSLKSNHVYDMKGNLGWWFQIFFVMFTPKLGEDEPILTTVRLFQRGWFNHQLVTMISNGTLPETNIAPENGWLEY